MAQNTDAKRKPSSLQRLHHHTLVELENYKLLVESVSDYAIFLLDTQGNVMTWNKGAEKNKGYKDTEIIGRHFSNFYLQHDVDAKKPERELELAQKFGRIEDEDWRVRKDGSRFWANVIITALYSPDGELVGYAKVTRDLTERKRQEDDLRKANTQLRRQRRELESLNESKDEFISLASHQLRTPATAIKQLLGMLIEGFQGEMAPEHLTLIQKAYESNERQLSIVDSLLKVAQIDSGKVILRKTATDVCKLLVDVIDEQTDSIEEREQEIEFDKPPEPIMVTLDSKYFRMALENLIDNASKYSHPNSQITVMTNVEKGQAVITIQDEGVGIAEKDLDDLFMKFKRIPNELSPKVSGSGLGLYWVREVIHLHDGTIEVSSEPGEGTMFTIKLPAGAIHA